MKFLLLAVASVLALTACGGTQNAETRPEKQTTTAAKPEPKFDEVAYAKKAEANFVAQLGAPIADGCDKAVTNWQCFYDGVKAKDTSRLDIELTTPGDVTEADAKAFSERARIAWFNFLGAEYKDLDMIVSFVNGRDTGTTNRRDVPLLNR